jgi:hypothetical protein
VSERNATRLALWVDWFKTLVGPILVLLAGIVGFFYELIVGHDTTLATLSIGLIAMALGLSADLIRKGS